MTNVLITGANRGIGLELARQYRDRGDNVIAVCRSAGDELSNLGVELIDSVDVGNGESVHALKDKLAGRQIDVLINNAGILRHDKFGEIDYDGMLEQFQVNTLGPLRVTEALRETLSEGSKVGIVTSRVGSIEDNQSGGIWGYRASKSAANMVGTNLMHELKPLGIAVALLHPGLVATEMTGGSGIEPKMAAAGLIQRMDELNLANSGRFWHAKGDELPW